MSCHLLALARIVTPRPPLHYKKHPSSLQRPCPSLIILLPSSCSQLFEIQPGVIFFTSLEGRSQFSLSALRNPHSLLFTTQRFTGRLPTAPHGVARSSPMRVRVLTILPLLPPPHQPSHTRLRTGQLSNCRTSTLERFVGS